MSSGNLHTTDILVVGAGPAGSSAAWAAAAAGLSVIAIEKRRRIGEPIQCAEYIPAPLGLQAHDPAVKIQATEEMLSAYNSSVFEHLACRGIMINRTQFDQGLAKRAQKAGAELWMRCYLHRLDNKEQRARVTTSTGVHTIHYKLLIAADGPKSRVADLLGLNALSTIKTRQYSVALQVRSRSSKVWLSSRYPGGYAWLFPMGRVANLGLGFVAHSSDELKKQLDNLHKDLQTEGTVGSKVLSRTGGPIPVAGLRKPLCTSNTLFVGDAAGLTHPISGAGIAAAVTSGELAGQAAASFLSSNSALALLEYVQEIQDLYAASLDRAVQRRRVLNLHWRQQGQLPRDVLRKSWIASPEYFQT